MAYLLTCPKCAANVPVELGMSGEFVPCACGAKVEVPMLRTLRTLPRTDDGRRDLPAGVWSWRHAVAVVGGLVLLCGILMGGFFAYNRYRFDPFRQWNHDLPQVTPARSWEIWTAYFRDTPIGPYPWRNNDIKRESALHFYKLDNYQKMLTAQVQWEYFGWGMAALGGITIASALFFPSRATLSMPHLEGIEMTPTRGKRRE